MHVLLTRLHAHLKSAGPQKISELIALGYHPQAIVRWTASGALRRLSRGLYGLPEVENGGIEGLQILMKKAPRGVLCLLSALEFHGLTTQQPRELWYALPHGIRCPQIDFPPTHCVHLLGGAYRDGIELHDREEVEVRVYGVAKTIVDCFRFRHLVGLDVALEAMREGVRSKRVDWNDIGEQAQRRRIAKTLLPYMEALQ
jgi:predicted transcriptional regulator of viral defense system